MSGILMTPCWNLSLGTTYKIVLLSLADNASDEGFCFPHVATIMRRTSLSRPTVFRSLQWLEEQGYIRRLSGAIEGKGNKYIVDPTGNAAAERDRERDFLGVARQRHQYHTETPQSHSDTPPVSHRDPIGDAPIVEVLNNQVNNQGTSTPHFHPTKPKRAKREPMQPLHCSAELGQRWLQNRRETGARVLWNENTQERHDSEAKKAGISPEAAYIYAMQRGWQAFHAKLYLQDEKPQQNGGGYISAAQQAREERKEWVRKIFEPFAKEQNDPATVDAVKTTRRDSQLQLLEC